MRSTIPVVFRIWQGELVALFPDQPYGHGYILSYQHIGQHGAACPSLLREGRYAKPSEYRALLCELQAYYKDSTLSVSRARYSICDAPHAA